jgi:hypothetical protein
MVVAEEDPGYSASQKGLPWTREGRMTQDKEYCMKENTTFPSGEFRDGANARIHRRGSEHYRDTGEKLSPLDMPGTTVNIQPDAKTG